MKKSNLITNNVYICIYNVSKTYLIKMVKIKIHEIA